MPSLHTTPPVITSPGPDRGVDPGDPSLATHASFQLSCHSWQDTPGAPCSEGPLVPGEGVTVPSFPSRAQGDSLYPERERLHAWPDLKVRMLQEFCAPSTRITYCFLRGLFASWCAAHQLDPHQTTVNMILCELHTLSVQRQ